MSYSDKKTIWGNGGVQDAIVEMSSSEGERFVLYTLSGDDVTFSVDRSCVESDTLSLGTTISSMLTMTVLMESGKVEVIDPDDVYAITVTLYHGSSDEYDGSFVIGTFYKSDYKYENGNLIITAYDSFSSLEVPYDVSEISFERGLSAYELLDGMLAKRYEETLYLIDQDADFPSYNGTDKTFVFPDFVSYYSFLNVPTNVKTIADMIRFIAGVECKCAFMNGNSVGFKSYDKTGDFFEITPDDRYSSSISAKDIWISEVVGSVPNSTEPSHDGYSIDVSSCTGSFPVVSEFQIEPFDYVPMQATIKSAPYLIPPVYCKYTDKNGSQKDTFITHVNYVFNGKTTIEGVGSVSAYDTRIEKDSVSEEDVDSKIEDALDEYDDTVNDMISEAINALKPTSYSGGHNLTSVSSPSGSIKVFTQLGFGIISYSYTTTATISSRTVIDVITQLPRYETALSVALYGTYSGNACSCYFSTDGKIVLTPSQYNNNNSKLSIPSGTTFRVDGVFLI